jgi:FtsP/CotA-like multicopper oxidase with cupredoxin domain
VWEESVRLCHVTLTTTKKRREPAFVQKVDGFWVSALYDTVNLKSQKTVRIKIVQTMKGIRMFHCHLLEHEDLGMMGRLDVI